MHAAAQAFALQYPQGGTASIVPLPDGRFWVVAAQDGAVLARTDQLLPTLEHAEQTLAELLAQRPTLRACNASNVLQVITSTVHDASLLLPVRSRWSRLPWPVRLFVVAVIASAAIPSAWQAWRHAARSVTLVPASDASAAWDQVVQDFQRAIRIHPGAELVRVLQSLQGLPLNAQGWLLHGAGCQPQDGSWTCSARYTREIHGATNQAFARIWPEGWQVQFQPLDEAALAWTVSGQGASLLTVTPPAAADVDTVLASTLQGLRPAFSQLALAAPTPVLIEPPRDTRGQPIAPVQALPVLRQRPITLVGPLRSFALLADLDAVAAWSALSLRLMPGVRPDTTASTLTVELQGVLYEKD